MKRKKRFVVIVLDGFGIGAMEDAAIVRPDDVGANTAGHIFLSMPKLRLPNLEKLGLMNALGSSAGAMKQVEKAIYGRSALAHFGADTFYGHQEIMGSKPKKPMSMPFSQTRSMVAQDLRLAGHKVDEIECDDLKIILVDDFVYIGDNIEADPGQVINITATLDKIDFSCVKEIGRIVRKTVKLPRVIALGGRELTMEMLLHALEVKNGQYIGINCPRSGVYRTGYQCVHLGYGIEPAGQVPTLLGSIGIPVVLLGKVADIVENETGKNIPLIDTEEVMQETVREFQNMEQGFICANVQETDIAGHRQDTVIYAEKLIVADRYIGNIMRELSDEDVLIVMADHGNDPTVGHNRHTREYVPLLIARHKGYEKKNVALGTRTTLADVGATVMEYFGGPTADSGVSFLKLI